MAHRVFYPVTRMHCITSLDRDYEMKHFVEIVLSKIITKRKTLQVKQFI